MQAVGQQASETFWKFLRVLTIRSYSLNRIHLSSSRTYHKAEVLCTEELAGLTRQKHGCPGRYLTQLWAIISLVMGTCQALREVAG